MPCTFTDPDKETGVHDNTPKQLAYTNKDEKPAVYREKTVQDPDDVRTEYTAIADYISNITNIRFTLAGLYVAAIGFVAGVVLAATSTWEARAAGSFVAIWLTFCLYVMELRNRSLYTNLAHRGIDIEHNNWRLIKSLWYSGCHSRQYKEPPVAEADREDVPSKPGPDRSKIAWMKEPLPDSVSRYISHTLGFDLLYGGGIVFWSITLLVSLYYVAKSWCLL